MDQSVTFVLNGYRRPKYLAEQYRAVLSQTIEPAEVLLWRNDAGEKYQTAWEGVSAVGDKCISATANINLGVWARFAFALMAKSKFVCILDDDTIPGPRWLENCFQTLSVRSGLLGTRGVIFGKGGNYEIDQEIGVFAPNEEIECVDIVTHNWFFEKEWLTCYWRELPPNGFERAGEDIHFSYVLQKYMQLPTLVPPHPVDDLSLWGSHPVKSFRYGNDPEAIWRNDGLARMNDYLQIALKGGFQIINR